MKNIYSTGVFGCVFTLLKNDTVIKTGFSMEAMDKECNQLNALETKNDNPFVVGERPHPYWYFYLNNVDKNKYFHNSEYLLTDKDVEYLTGQYLNSK